MTKPLPATVIELHPVSQAWALAGACAEQACPPLVYRLVNGRKSLRHFNRNG